jgi:hypothetical protein
MPLMARDIGGAYSILQQGTGKHMETYASL